MLLMLVIWLPWCFLLFGQMETWGPYFGAQGGHLATLSSKVWAPRWPLGQMCSGLVLAIWRDVLGPRVGHLAKCCVFWRCCLGPAFLDASFRVAHDA